MAGRKSVTNKVVVVTGAGSGIGRATARAFAKRGARLVLADIDEGSLLSAAGELEALGCEVRTRVVDVTKAEMVEALCDSTYEMMGRCDVLVNNAGVAMIGLVENTSLEDWQWVMGINFWGVVHGCHYFYPRMIAQGGGGHIVNVASGAGLAPIPALAVYCASKYAVVGFSETLRGEAALHGIGVSVICPAFVATNIARSVKVRMETRNYATEPELIDRSTDFLAKHGCSPDKVGETVFRVVEKNRGVVPVTASMKAMDLAHRLFRGGFRIVQIVALKVIQRAL